LSYSTPPALRTHHQPLSDTPRTLDPCLDAVSHLQNNNTPLNSALSQGEPGKTFNSQILPVKPSLTPPPGPLQRFKTELLLFD